MDRKAKISNLIDIYSTQGNQGLGYKQMGQNQLNNPKGAENFNPLRQNPYLQG